MSRPVPHCVIFPLSQILGDPYHHITSKTMLSFKKKSPPPVTCLSGGGGGLAGTYPIHRGQRNYWRMNNSARVNTMLSAVNKENSSLSVNLGFPRRTNTQQLQQSGIFTISCQMTVIFLVSQTWTHLN